MQKYPKSELVNRNHLSKNSVIAGAPSKVSRVLTLLDVIALIKKDVPAAIIIVDPVKTSKVFTLLSWVTGIGTQNRRSKVATWDDAVTFIGLAGGTINIDLSASNADMLSTTEMTTFPSYKSGSIPRAQRSEFITYTEMTHLMNNSTFV